VPSNPALAAPDEETVGRAGAVGAVGAVNSHCAVYCAVTDILCCE
jgi:hypothetical protein